MKQIYTHINTGERLTIKRMYGQVASCESEITTVITNKPYLATNTVICNINNLREFRL